MIKCKKIPYQNKHQANKQAKYYEEKDGYKSKAYGCNICGKVHLTTVNKK